MLVVSLHEEVLIVYGCSVFIEHWRERAVVVELLFAGRIGLRRRVGSRQVLVVFGTTLFTFERCVIHPRGFF